MLGLVTSILMLAKTSNGFKFPGLELVKMKYVYPMLISSMKTSMYDYVNDDSEIEEAIMNNLRNIYGDNIPSPKLIPHHHLVKSIHTHSGTLLL